MILSAQSIRKHCRLTNPLINPFYERSVAFGMTYGLSQCGYDIRVAENLVLERGDFILASSVEHFNIPDYLMARVCDKSSWARRGITVQNTVCEPGWRGKLTLEIACHWKRIEIKMGMPIAQMIFESLDEPTEIPYNGKYQDQPAGPQQAIDEVGS